MFQVPWEVHVLKTFDKMGHGLGEAERHLGPSSQQTLVGRLVPIQTDFGTLALSTPYCYFQKGQAEALREKLLQASRCQYGLGRKIHSAGKEINLECRGHF